MTPEEQFHRNIKSLQAKSGLKNDELGKLMGLSKGVLNVKLTRLKKGNAGAWSVSDLGKMCRIFECRPADLFDGVEF